MSDEIGFVITFIAGILLGSVLSLIILLDNMAPRSTISSGKTFIMGHASYQCSKMNELKADE